MFSFFKKPQSKQWRKQFIAGMKNAQAPETPEQTQIILLQEIFRELLAIRGEIMDLGMEVNDVQYAVRDVEGAVRDVKA